MKIIESYCTAESLMLKKYRFLQVDIFYLEWVHEYVFVAYVYRDHFDDLKLQQFES